MDSRTALNQEAILRFTNSEGGAVQYRINREIGRGGSCIVYDAFYKTNAGDQKAVRIKECYPYKLKIFRKESGELIAETSQAEDFQKAQKKMESDFLLCNRIYSADGLSDSLINTIDIYKGNNTSYIVSAFLPGNTLDIYKPASLKYCLSIVKITAEILQHIHDAGFLYLDIKPENILVIDSQVLRIQLFDFDSLIPFSAVSGRNKKSPAHIRISYTKGFAALELQMGNLNQLGPYTDVYGISSLLFFLIFGDTPKAADCERDAQYDFSEMAYSGNVYQDKLFKELTAFFHNTLASYYPDRYRNMHEAIIKLDNLCKLADTTIPFISSTAINEPGIFVGRNDELTQLAQWFADSKSQCLFITGMGGIGKSTLLRKYLAANRDSFDSVLYLYYNGSIQDMINNDSHVFINTTAKDKEESRKDYFDRKLRQICQLTKGTRTILVIDNFYGEITPEFIQLTNADWRIIVVTRHDQLRSNYPVIHLQAIKESSDLYSLFQTYSNKSLQENDRACLDNIIRKISGHTLVLELVARQMIKSHITLAETSKLMDAHGFADIAPEKVYFEKDSLPSIDTIKNIISAIFCAEQQSPLSRKILKCLSLFNLPGIDIHLFAEMLALNSKDSLNDLMDDGWINISNETLSLHPVIREIIDQWEWSEDYRSAALEILAFLFDRFKLNQEDTRLIQLPNHESSDHGIICQIYSETISPEIRQTAPDQQLPLFLQLSENVLENCQKVPQLRESSSFNNLLCCLVVNLPPDREEYILKNAEELFHDSSWIQPYDGLILADVIANIYYKEKNFCEAFKTIEQSKTFIRVFDNYAKAQYYSLLSDFFDERLAGAYDSDNEFNDFHHLIDAINKSIRYIKMSHKPDSKQLLLKYLLSKINVLIRHNPEEKGIKALLGQAKQLYEELPEENFYLRQNYCMSCAWYFTYTIPDSETVEEFIQDAENIAREICPVGLEFIDEIIIPAANMFLEFNKYEKSADKLLSGIEICQTHNKILPYSRKKMELYQYLLEVYDSANETEKVRSLIDRIDKEKAAIKDSGIATALPSDCQH